MSVFSGDIDSILKQPTLGYLPSCKMVEKEEVGGIVGLNTAVWQKLEPLKLIPSSNGVYVSTSVVLRTKRPLGEWRVTKCQLPAQRSAANMTELRSSSDTEAFSSKFKSRIS